MAKSYFAVLGVTSGASPEEVRSAYRRLAKEYHPDCYEGGSGPFRRIQEAYAVLGNPLRRRDYEQRRSAAAMPRPAGGPTFPEPLIQEQKPVDMGQISPIRSFQTFSPSFDEILDWLGQAFSTLKRSKSGRVQNLTLEIPLTREQASRGGHARVMVPTRAVCPACRGAGGIGWYECASCEGGGVISGEVPVSIAFPAGLVGDHAVVIPLDRFGIDTLHATVLFRPRDINGA